MRPTAHALIGAACVLPLLLANAVVANRVEPFFSAIRPGPHTNPQEHALLFVVVGLLAVGAAIAARPLVRRSKEGRRRFYPLNGAIAVALLAVFSLLSATLGAEIYRCDVLQVPNCD